jgi:hypothetical protein
VSGTEFRYRDLKVGEQLQQERLELLVGAVQFINEKHRGPVVAGIDCLKQRTPNQELLGKDAVLSGATVV